MEGQFKIRRPRYLPWFICGIAGLFYYYEYFLRIVPSVMAQQVIYAYHLNAVTFSVLVGSFYFIYIPMQLIIGVFFDRFKPRRLLTFALISCSLGCLFFANGDCLWLACLGRLLIGFGSAFFFVGICKLATLWLPLDRFALVAGIATSIGMFGGLTGDNLLSRLMERAGWRLTNYFVGAIGVVLAFIIFLVLKNNKKRYFTVCQSHWLPDLKSGYRGLIELMKNPQMWINCSIGCLLLVPLSGFAETWGISYLVHVIHLSKSQAASAVSMIFLGWFLGAPIIGWLSDVIKQRRLPLTVGATLAAILISILIYVPNVSHEAVFYILFLFGFCSSSSVVVLSISREIGSRILTGTSVAFTNMLTMVSGVSIPVIGFILNLTWRHDAVSRIPFDASTYQMALSVLPISLVIAVFLTFYLQDTYCKPVVKNVREIRSFSN